MKRTIYKQTLESGILRGKKRSLLTYGDFLNRIFKKVKLMAQGPNPFIGFLKRIRARPFVIGERLITEPLCFESRPQPQRPEEE